MPTVFGVGAYRVVVYTNDHGPAHVHAVGPEGVARFSLGDAPGDVRLMEVDGIPKKDLKIIATKIIDRHEACLDMWRSIHGD
jgi:hypothetical protein